jgi:hypothetical protein
MVGITGDRAGQLGENEEYWIGRKGSDPRRLGPNEQALECTDTYGTYGIPKLSSIMCH